MMLQARSTHTLAATLATAIAFGASGALAAAAPLPSYASSDEAIKGTISSVSGKYSIAVRDDRGFIDNVTLHDGTVINPTGLTLAAGQTVTIHGRNVGSSFSANEIDTPYESHGDGVTYAYGFPDNYGGPYWPASYGYGYGYPYAPAYYGSIGFYFGGYGYGGYGHGYYGHGYYGHGYYGHGYYGHGYGYSGHGSYGSSRRSPYSSGSYGGGSHSSFAGGSRGSYGGGSFHGGGGSFHGGGGGHSHR
jgi:hypothetical protein